MVAARRIGRETVNYVANIFKTYYAYRLLAANEAAWQQVRESFGQQLIDAWTWLVTRQHPKSVTQGNVPVLPGPVITVTPGNMIRNSVEKKIHE